MPMADRPRQASQVLGGLASEPYATYRSKFGTLTQSLLEHLLGAWKDPSQVWNGSEFIWLRNDTTDHKLRHDTTKQGLGNRNVDKACVRVHEHKDWASGV
ncbi:hypothetical protein ACH5RR_032718 [Cinchona calisaya]|uniref:Uncharacterized protein n=1 Tax=Cinchona calisaya TaxID=153742 RepID=A0ABD2YIZ3_9GENT